MATRWYRAPELCGSFFSKVLFVPMMGIHSLYVASYCIKVFLLSIVCSCFNFLKTAVSAYWMSLLIC